MPVQVEGERYARATLGEADAVAVLIPSLGIALGVDELVAKLDGPLLTW
jgi:hypothetical protein